MHKSEIIFQIDFPFSMFNKQDMLAVVKLQCELLPEYLPEKWGWYEPLNHSFDMSHIELLIPESGKCVDTWWKKSGKNKARGAWMPRWESGVDYLKDTHSTVYINIYDTKNFPSFLYCFKKLGSKLKADYGFLDIFTEKYKDIAYQNGLSPYQEGLSTTTHILRHWLPDMMWANIFGPPYVKLFGKERLLSTPAYSVEELGPETVFIQLTPSLEDLFTKFDEVMAAREAAKKHLGYECFYQETLGYDRREEPEKAGRVFRVPEFHLLDDYQEKIVKMTRNELQVLLDLKGVPKTAYSLDGFKKGECLCILHEAGVWKVVCDGKKIAYSTICENEEDACQVFFNIMKKNYGWDE